MTQRTTMIKERILLVAGCSHAAGHEIDGEVDSEHNRQYSFGGRLAEKLNRKLINIAVGGFSNPAIARSVELWFKRKYDPETMDVYVLVSWTESSRMDVPQQRPMDYKYSNRHVSEYFVPSSYYAQINTGWTGTSDEERDFLKPYQDFIANNETFLEMLSATTVLRLQYLFKSLDVDYLMCNSLYMFNPNPYTASYLSLIDQNHYVDMIDRTKCFYWLYRNQGYENPKAKYWHHDETPHELYAKYLKEFIDQNQ